MSGFTKIQDHYELYAEDIDCDYCLYFKGKRKKFLNGCWEETCRFEQLRREAIEKGRIIRKKGINHNESDQNNRKGGIKT